MATYYVDTAADPGGDGTTQALTGANCAWDTIADVNAASFSAGDSILFKKGCVWREILLPPSNGSAGNQITFGAYGTGDDPIIYGSNQISTWTNTNVAPETGDLLEEGFEANPGYDVAGWSETVGAGSTVDEDSTAVARPSDGGGQCLLIQKVSPNFNAITSNAISGSEQAVTYIRGCVRYDAEGLGDTNEVRLITAYDGNGVADANIVWSIRLRQIAGGAKKTFFYLYNNGAIANAKSNDISASTWYKYEVKYDHTNHLCELKLDGAVSLADTAIGGTHKTGVRYIALGDATNAYTVTAYIDRVAADSAGYLADTLTLPAGAWKATCATEPSQVWFIASNGTITQGTNEAVLTNVNAEYDWNWTNGYLIVYADTDPDARYASVEASVRSECVQLGTYVATRSYLTFDGLKFAYPANFGVAQWQDADAPSIIIQNCTFLKAGINLEGAGVTIQHNTMIGPSPKEISDGAIIVSFSTATSPMIHGNTISGFHSRGIWIGKGVDAPTVTDNIVHDIDHTVGSAGEGYGIDFDGATTPITGVVTCTGNTVYNMPETGNGWGIYLENCSEGSDISDNLIYSCAHAGIALNNYTTEQGNNVGAVVSYNVIYGCNRGIYILNVSGVDFWNNVVDGAVGADKIGVAMAGTTTNVGDIDIRNNIFGSDLTWVCRVPDNVWTNNILEFDYNCLENITAIYEGGDSESKTLADLQGAGRALNCFTTTPAFTNQAGHDYTLQDDSPCINIGVNVGLTADYLGNAMVGVPDIGAYEFQATNLVPAEGVQLQFSDSPTLVVTHVLVTQEGAQTTVSDNSTFVFPTISGLSDTTLNTLQAVTITGTDFKATEGTVKFNGTTAAITTWADTSILTAVPIGTTSGNVVVYDAGSVFGAGYPYTINPSAGSKFPAILFMHMSW